MLDALDEQATVGATPRSSSAPTTGTTSARSGAGDDIWGKPAVPQFEPLGHTPLLIHWPGAATTGRLWGRSSPVRQPGRAGPATPSPPTSTCTPRSPRSSAPSRPIGRTVRSLVPLLDGTADRRARLGHRRRLRQLGPGHRRPPQVRQGPRGRRLPAVDVVEPVVDDAAPGRRARRPAADRTSRATLDHHPRLRRFPSSASPSPPGDQLPFWASGARFAGQHHLYDLDVDPDEGENRAGERVERELVELLRTALDELEAPAEQARATRPDLRIGRGGTGPRVSASERSTDSRRVSVGTEGRPTRHR